MLQKLAFVRSVLEQNDTIAQICRNFKISRQTGYEVLALYKEKGEEGLRPQSHAPLSCPHKTPDVIEEMIINSRINNPTWGARKIHAILVDKSSDCPSISTISNILKRNGFIKIEESLKRKALIRFEREHSNDLWQMDFKGKFKLQNDRWCYPLTILDDYSRFSLCLRPCRNEQRNTVFKHLYEIFEEYGLPDQINVDNGNPWGNSRSFSHTKLTVWLMRLGIKITHSRPNHPQTNGKIERFHRTLKKDLLEQKMINSFCHAKSLFESWRRLYNYERPHEAIGMLTPSKRYKPSKRTMPSKLPQVEYNEGSIIRKVRGNGGVSYDGNEYLVGKAFHGLDVQIKYSDYSKLLEIYFNQNKIFVYNLA